MLEGAGARTVSAGYWNAYRLSFISEERVVAAATLGFGDGGGEERYPRFRQIVRAAGPCTTYLTGRGSATARRLRNFLAGRPFSEVTVIYTAFVPQRAGCRTAPQALPARGPDRENVSLPDT